VSVTPRSEVVSPDTLDDALAFLAEHASEGWQPIAGGTDVMVGVNAHRETRSRWLDLSRLGGELGGISESDGQIRIGALTTMTALRRSTRLAELAPIVGEAAATIGAVQIQNRATVAGNVANASPAGDTLPVWLALDAEVELASTSGRSLVPYRDFTTAYRETVRLPHELVTALVFRTPAPGTRMRFRKVGTRAAQAISKVVFAGLARCDSAGRYEHLRLAFGSVGPTPCLALGAEEIALGRAPGDECAALAAEKHATDLAPIDDVRSTAAYRIAVAGNLAREFLAAH
jgi:CO/xanthine dehydrogenase FAD-binding subunit